MVRLTFTLENGNDVIPLSNVVANDYLKMIGASGFGLAPTEVNIIEGAGGGGRWRNTRRGPRDIDLPIAIFGETADEVEVKMQRLVAVMSDRYTTPRIVARYPTGKTFETEFHYVAGANHVHGVDSDGEHYVKWGLTLRCPDPYWTARDAISYALRAANSGRGLIRTGGGGLSRLRLSSSQAIGTVDVSNTGDVDAYAVWTIRGPGSALTATRLVDGQSFIFNVPIVAGETITIDTQAKTVIDNLGNSRYSNLGTAPKLFAIPPGDTQVSVVFGNVTTDSLVTMFFKPRREFVF